MLVDNAGVNVFHEPLAMPEEDWRRCFAVDLEGAWHSARAVLPAMLAQGGGSHRQHRLLPQLHASSRTPFPTRSRSTALLGLVRALGIEYAARGVRVNAIAPGYIETQIAIDYWNTFPDPEAERQQGLRPASAQARSAGPRRWR